MGSDLYISIDVQHDGGGHRDPKVWSALWEGPSTDLDCHVKPDLILIYRKPDKNTLQLVHLGSHHELFGK